MRLGAAQPSRLRRLIIAIMMTLTIATGVAAIQPTAAGAGSWTYCNTATAGTGWRLYEAVLPSWATWMQLTGDWQSSANPYMWTWAYGLESINLSKIACQESNFGSPTLVAHGYFGLTGHVRNTVLGISEACYQASWPFGCYSFGVFVPYWKWQIYGGMKYIKGGAGIQTNFDTPGGAWEWKRTHGIY
jgi:hypothetical protein